MIFFELTEMVFNEKYKIFRIVGYAHLAASTVYQPNNELAIVLGFAPLYASLQDFAAPFEKQIRHPNTLTLTKSQPNQVANQIVLT